ncbi:MAG TPA: hypothetical protein VE954_18470 [Oligoflexus sp.]|uniref:hypothetical protein n=1 Tax=Oligoflexus sp. TaxID=1971216 RepID=UPI002D72E474|nr:hypothetical protein [Oligoflexus sp.]HYX35087.1 hypothetical protein [Oligoflexus sp.]
MRNFLVTINSVDSLMFKIAKLFSCQIAGLFLATFSGSAFAAGEAQIRCQLQIEDYRVTPRAVKLLSKFPARQVIGQLFSETYEAKFDGQTLHATLQAQTEWRKSVSFASSEELKIQELEVTIENPWHGTVQTIKQSDPGLATFDGSAGYLFARTWRKEGKPVGDIAVTFVCEILNAVRKIN